MYTGITFKADLFLLIISSDKVGNKTEVIVGVSKKEDAYEKPSKEKGRSEAFRHALEANSDVEIEKPSSRHNGKNPWSVIEKLNSEIADIRSTMLEIKEQKENLREQKLRQKELERLKRFEENEKPMESNLSSGLEKFDIDKTQKN